MNTFFFTDTGLSRSEDSGEEKKKRFRSNRWGTVDVSIDFSVNNSDIFRNIVIISYIKTFETNIKTSLI